MIIKKLSERWVDGASMLAPDFAHEATVRVLSQWHKRAKLSILECCLDVLLEKPLEKHAEFKPQLPELIYFNKTFYSIYCWYYGWSEKKQAYAWRTKTMSLGKGAAAMSHSSLQQRIDALAPDLLLWRQNNSCESEEPWEDLNATTD